MGNGAGRILTTHTGSLPRPDDLIQMMWAKGDGIPVDAERSPVRVATAVQEVVDAAGRGRRQHRQRRRDVQAELRHLRQGPAARLRRRVGAELLLRRPRRLSRAAPRSWRPTPGGASAPRRPATAPISVKDGEADRRSTWPTSASGRRRGRDAGTFSSAASPGVVSLFFGNEFYATDEEYVFAIAEAMRHEYEAIAAPAATVQLDCPDLAMGRHSAYADMDPRRVPPARRHEHRGAQPRRAQHPRRSAPHAPLLGELPGPPPPRRRPRRHHRSGLDGQAPDGPVRGRQPPSRPRVDAVRGHARCPTTRSSAPA